MHVRRGPRSDGIRVSALDDNTRAFGDAFLCSLLGACDEIGMEPMPFVVFMFPPDSFQRDVYEHVYRKAEETARLFPGNEQPHVMGVAPVEDV